MNDLKIYVNNYFFQTLYSESHYSDRPEFYRTHEKSLWTIYQFCLLGTHQISILDGVNSIVLQTNDALILKQWVAKNYPAFADQLEEKIYTKQPHPLDIL